MNRNHRIRSNHTVSAVEVKSKFGAEFRRFSLEKSKAGRFAEFYGLLQRVHRIPSEDVVVGYADAQGDLLPINNDDNYLKAISTASPLLRIFLQRREEADRNTPIRTPKNKALWLPERSRQKHGVTISLPRDFRPLSSVIDADVLPEWQRRVRLYRDGSNRPLGFYIRDGTTLRVSAQGVEKVPGIFISRIVPGGLAESTGMLAVNDEVLDVNGIEVAGKSLDQVTDMMVANSYKLVVTVKPADQRYNVSRESGRCQSQEFVPRELEEFEEDEEDLIVEPCGQLLPVPRYELHLGLRNREGVTPSGSLGSLSLTDSEEIDPVLEVALNL